MKNIARRVLVNIVALAMCCAAFAVPAERGWYEVTLTNGSTVEVELRGDEFYHYWATRDGKIAEQQADGKYIITEEAVPTIDEQLAKRAKSSRQEVQIRKAIRYGARQIQRTLIIIVGFSDRPTLPAHNAAYYKNLMGGETNSAKDYFRQSSEGAYVPDCDTYGPYVLPHPMAYYGENDPNRYNKDIRPDQMVVDACALAYTDGCDFSKYDENNDGTIDNIYIIYAGFSEASQAPAYTIWPHSWEVQAGRVSGQLVYNGKRIGHYACSSELRGHTGIDCAGIGTFCHEFSHVIGLPDYYVTTGGASENSPYTPYKWSLMDQGSYNGDGMYPPLYSIYDKYFMGWKTPTILKDPENVAMPVGADYARQITSDDQLAAVTSTNTVYYLENRQQTGYDSYLPGHGMVVWKVAYDESAWNNGQVNNTAGVLRYTVVPANTNVSQYGKYPSDPFPGSGNVTSFTPTSGHALTQIAENNQIITFKYNGGLDGHKIVYECTYCRPIDGPVIAKNGEDLTIHFEGLDPSNDPHGPTVYLGTTKLTNRTDFVWSEKAGNVLTIYGSAITGSEDADLRIHMTWIKKRWAYEVKTGGNGYILFSNPTGSVQKDYPLQLEISPMTSWHLSDAGCWNVTMGENTLQYGTDFTYENDTFRIAQVTGDVVISINGGLFGYWYADGVLFDSTLCIGQRTVLPATNPTACSGNTFIGWTRKTCSSDTPPTLVNNGDGRGGGNYNAVFYNGLTYSTTCNPGYDGAYYDISYSPSYYGMLYGTLTTSPANRARSGQTVTITARSNDDCYELKSLRIIASGMTVPIDANNRFVMPNQAITVSAYFDIKQYTISVDAGANGNVSIDMGDVQLIPSIEEEKPESTVQ